jgi:hypothetical protein
LLRRRCRCRPALEPLEDRTVPAPVTVTNLNDFVNGTTTSIASLIANPGADGISLREALQAANNTLEANTITFQAGLTGTITLINGELRITRPVTITGPGAGVLTVSGNNVSRIFDVVAGSGVSISGLTLTKGNAGIAGTGVTGGAIRIGVSSLTLSGMVITASTADIGGGIYVGPSGQLSLENSTVSGNFATSGGGLYLNSETLIRNCTISGNQIGEGDGGGVLHEGGPLTVENTTISGNTTLGSGGGLMLKSGTATVRVRNSTIAFNTAFNDFGNGVGGGIAISAGSIHVTLQSTLVADNAVGMGGLHPDLSGSAVAINCLVENTSGTTFLAGSANNVTGADPRLGPLANNGGPTRTHALLAGSPAIDAGLDFAGQPTDQRGPGFARVVGHDADIGAFEVQTPPPAPLPSPPLPPAQIVAVAFKRKGKVRVRVLDAASGAVRGVLTPFPGFRGRLRLQLLDLNSDDSLDLIVKALVNGKRSKKIYDALTLAQLPPNLV